ncbi:MAG: endolytic transglycosylase MltG [Propionibacteriaceae bacterium]|jgi:UPF0755 protein|nr:endolytic transglycosylase MltG [Propionibacteriaceae bacterium]
MAKQYRVSWISSEGLRRAKSALAVALSLTILLGGMGVATWKAYGWYQAWQQRDDYIGDGDADVQVVVSPGQGWGRVADTLMAADVIKDPSLFEDEALTLAPNGPLQWGTWNLKTHLPAASAAKMMTDLDTNGKPKNLLVVKLTIKEGMRLADMAATMETQLGTTQAEFDAAVTALAADPASFHLNAAATANAANLAGILDPWRAAYSFGPAAGSIAEGYLFPATYDIFPPINSKVTDVFTMMADQFNKVATDLNLEAGAAALGLTPQQVVTIASILEVEVLPADQPKAARVFLNRFAANMPLQMNSTVDYGLGRSGLAKLSTADAQKDTPYSTYVHAGLPPTPIGNPSRAALEAALNPAEGPWLYWVTVDLRTGETVFTDSVDEFNAASERFHQWCAANPDVCK